MSEHESEVSPVEIRSAPKSGGESQVPAAVDTRVGPFAMLTAVWILQGCAQCSILIAELRATREQNPCVCRGLSKQNVTEYQPQRMVLDLAEPAADQDIMEELIARVEGLELQPQSVQSWLAANPGPAADTQKEPSAKHIRSFCEHRLIVAEMSEPLVSKHTPG